MKKKILSIAATVILATVFLTGCGGSSLNQEVVCGDIALNVPSDYYNLLEDSDGYWFFSNDNGDTPICVEEPISIITDSTGKFERVEHFEKMSADGEKSYELCDENTEEKNGVTYYTYTYKTNSTSFEGDLYTKEVCISKGDTHVHVSVSSSDKNAAVKLFGSVYKTIVVK